METEQGMDVMTNLKQVRESRGLSQSQLAKASGVNVRLIQNYEQAFRNINKASAETVLKLADALQCDIREIME